MSFKRLAVAGLALAIAGSAFAQAKPEDLIKLRQASFRVIGYHCGKVKALLDGQQFSQAELLASATVIQAVANAGLVNPLFTAGTDKGVGYRETAVKAEAFEAAHAGKLGDIAASFTKDANALVKVAAGGDKDAIKAQFGNLTKHCKSCHDDFRKTL